MEWNIVKHLEALEQDHQYNEDGHREDRKPSGKPPELSARLEHLKRQLEQEQYDEMVADVIRQEQMAKEASEGGLVTYRQQLSFGLHVIAMMAAFYAFGHVAGIAITSNKAAHPIYGLALMVVALFMETMLFVIRTSVPPKLHDYIIKRREEIKGSKDSRNVSVSQGDDRNGSTTRHKSRHSRSLGLIAQKKPKKKQV